MQTNLSFDIPTTIQADVQPQYAGLTLFTLQPELRSYTDTEQKCMEWFYSSPEPQPLLYTTDTLVIYTCKFASADDVKQARQMEISIKLGELIAVSVYKVFKPLGKYGYWHPVGNIYPDDAPEFSIV